MNIDKKLVENKILEILNIYKSGIKEFDLLILLQEEDLIPKHRSIENLKMFQIHFTLFNILYNLRDRLLENKEGILEIFTLSIILLPYEKKNDNILLYDPLGEYYKNMDNYKNTSEQDVEKMLDSFWIKYCASEQREIALNILGFDISEEVSFISIKKRYKSLATIHHPDKKGNKEEFQKIQEAMEVLKKWYDN